MNAQIPRANKLNTNVNKSNPNACQNQMSNPKSVTSVDTMFNPKELISMDDKGLNCIYPELIKIY